jgi:hypothetical protein
MVDQQTISNQLNQAIEKEVRFVIGDLHMQIIVLKQVMDLQQKAAEQTPVQPNQPRPAPPSPPPPQPTPHPYPPVPPQAETEPPLDRPEHRVTNGSGQ